MELAVIAGLGGGAVITVAIVAYLMHHGALDAEHVARAELRNAGELAARCSLLEGKLLAATNSAENWKAKAIDEENRADELQTTLYNLANSLPASGARDRVLQRWNQGSGGALPAIASTSKQAVQDSAKSTAPGSDELLKPGE